MEQTIQEKLGEALINAHLREAHGTHIDPSCPFCQQHVFPEYYMETQLNTNSAGITLNPQKKPAPPKRKIFGGYWLNKMKTLLP